MTMILPGRGNPVSYKLATIDPGDFGQEDAQVGDPNDAAINESSEKPEDQGGNGVPMIAVIKSNYIPPGTIYILSDMEQNDESDPTDLEGTSDEDDSDGSAGGIGAAYSMLRWVVADDRSKITDRLETGLERHKNKLPINEQKVNNLIAIHRHAQIHNPEGLHESQYWYHGAHKYARDLAKKHGVTTEHASGVLASLSPRAHWDHENKTAADYTLGKVGPNATKRSESLNISEAKKHEAYGFASKAYSKALSTHQSKLAAHVADPKKNKHPGEAPKPPTHLEIGKKFSDMGHQEAANAVYNQAKHEDLRVPEDAPDARTKPRNKKDPGALRKVTLITGTPNIAKATRIARGEKPDKVLGGEKVRSFHNNIMDPDDEHGHGDVTVDTWQHDAAMNKRQGEFPKPAEMQEDKEATHEAHRRLAANKEIDPKMPVSALQAQIWTHSRGLDSTKNRQNRDGSRPLVEHEGGVPTGWKAGVFKPNKFKFGIHKQGTKDKDYWIDPKGGPDENPDLNPPKEESFGYDIEPVKKESMLRWIITNIEDSKESEKANDVNTDYQSKADQAQDDFYFNYKSEKKSEPFGRNPDKIPTYMSPTLVGTSMKRWSKTNVGLDAMRKNIPNGGFTVHPKSGHSPSNGYQVGLEGHTMEPRPTVHEFMHDPNMADRVNKWQESKKHLFSDPDMHVGGWVHNNEVYLDPSHHVRDKDEAIAKGKSHNQIAIWDNANGEEINTGGSGEKTSTKHDDYDEAILHDEPEAALPKTDGENKVAMIRWSGKPPSQLWDSQHSETMQDPISTTTPGFGDMQDSEDENHENMGLSGHDTKVLSDQPLNEADGSDGNAVDPYKDLQTNVASKNNSRNWIMQGNTDSMDIAENARKVLASKVFSPQEQFLLIHEGEDSNTRARNLSSLQIENTHYALINEDEDE